MSMTTTSIDTFAQSYYTHNLPIYLAIIWETYFADTPRVNQVEIAYCQPWKRRMGLIRLSVDSSVTFIGINALLQHPQVPEDVLVVTIAHELVHYAHGFGSPLPKRYIYPHANNVVNCELERRALGEHLRVCTEWIDKEWFSFYDRQCEGGWADIPTLRGSAQRRHKAGC